MVSRELQYHLARHALHYIQPGMVIGLGSGSTASCLIEELGKKCASGLTISAVSSSSSSTMLAKKWGIPFLDQLPTSSIDLTFDGADEVDDEKNMIKGKGGALLREKIIISHSRQVIILIEERKRVSPSAAFSFLPVEVVPFSLPSTMRQLSTLGFQTEFHSIIRKNREGRLFTTDEGNYLIDLSLHSSKIPVRELHTKLLNIPGVVETGFFSLPQSTVLVISPEGQKIFEML